MRFWAMESKVPRDIQYYYTQVGSWEPPLTVNQMSVLSARDSSYLSSKHRFTVTFPTRDLNRTPSKQANKLTYRIHNHRALPISVQSLHLTRFCWRNYIINTSNTNWKHFVSIFKHTVEETCHIYALSPYKTKVFKNTKFQSHKRLIYFLRNVTAITLLWRPSPSSERAALFGPLRFCRSRSGLREFRLTETPEVCRSVARVRWQVGYVVCIGAISVPNK